MRDTMPRVWQVRRDPCESDVAPVVLGVGRTDTLCPRSLWPVAFVKSQVSLQMPLATATTEEFAMVISVALGHYS